MRRLLGVLVLAALLTGCQSAGTPPGTTTSPSPTAAASVSPTVLTDAVSKAAASTAGIKIDINVAGRSITGTGQVDIPGGKIAMTMGETADLELRVIGSDLYAKLPGVRSKPWAHFDLSRVKTDSLLLGATDLTRYTGILAGVVTIESTGPGHYQGTVDLAKAVAATGNQAMKNQIDQASDPGNVPFEASVDADGRLTRLSFTIETKDAGSAVNTMTLGPFGEPVSVTAPPAKDTEEAPDILYEQF